MNFWSLGARPDSIDRELMPARLTPLHYSLIYDNAELATHFVKNVEKIEWNKIKDAMPSAFLIACGQTSTSIDLLRCLVIMMIVMMYLRQRDSNL